VCRKLDSLMGSKNSTRKAVVHALFGDGGLSSLSNVAEFDCAVERMLHCEGTG